MAIIGTPARLIGDRERTRRLALGLSVGLDDQRLELQSLWEGFGNIAGPLVQAGTPLRRLARRAGILKEDDGPAAPLARQFIGLKHLVDLAHDQAPVAYANAQIEIAIPFGQIAIVSDQSVIGLDHLERSLTDAMASEFGAYIDPRQPPRVRFLHAHEIGADPGGSRHLRFYIGNGIFVPQAGLSSRTQAGHLWLRRPGDADNFYVARLPDGSEAAFHDGQTGIAFSGSVALTPATCREVLFNEAEQFGSVFFVGRQRETLGVTFQAWQAGDDGSARERATYQLTMPDHNHEELQGTVTLEPYHWYGVRRFSGEGRSRKREIAFELCFAPDSARPGRLQRQRPAGPHLEVTGFLVPDPQREERAARVWVDFDAAGNLVANALTPRMRSLVVGPTGLVGVFDRDGGGYSERGISIERQPTVSVAGRQLRVSEFQGSPSGHLMVQALGGSSFGYVALPPRVEAPRGFLVGPAPSTDGVNRPFDWLDAAGLVEARDEAPEPSAPGVGSVRPQPYVGLASWLQSAGASAVSLLWDAAGNLRVGREAGGSQAIAPGTDILLGPLRVRFEPG